MSGGGSGAGEGGFGMMRKASEGSLEGHYTLGETVGSGGFGKVKLAIHNLTREKCAIKIIDKEAIGEDLPRVKTELKALKTLSHQNICRLFQVVETEKRFYIVMEYCSGGELFDYIVKKQYLPEPEARHFFRQIVAVLAYVHHMGFAHRDLKPENLLLTDDLQLKLIDFGLCANPDSGLRNVLSTCCGSPAYAAPELIKGEPYFGNEADVWSMGILLYALLCGFLPFEDENIQVLYNKIARSSYVEPGWLSSGSKSVLRGMLQKEPKQRMTIQQLLAHPWVLKNYDLPLKWKTIYDRNMIDEDVTREMARYYDMSFDQMYKELKQWKFDDYSATYFCLLARKRRSSSIHLPFPKKATKVERRSSSLLNSPTIHASLERGMDHCHSDEFNKAFVDGHPTSTPDSYKKSKKSYLCAMENGGGREAGGSQTQTPVSTKIRTRMINTYEEANKENVHFRHRSDKERPTQDRCSEKDAITRPKSVYSTPGGHVSGMATPRDKLTVPNWTRETPLSVQLKAKSSEELDSEPEESPRVSGERTPRSKQKTGNFSRRAFASVERKLDRVKNLLTPGRKPRPHTPARLRRTKTLVNVSTTSSDDPELVLNELIRVFNNKGIVCEQNGWKIHGKAKDGRGRVNLTLELEVVVVETLGTVGVRRKRLNGDSFMYKRVCEDILKLASL